MDAPINPPSTSGGGRNELPAYVSNGVIGMRVRDVPLDAGMTLISGYTGEHPLRQIEAMARAPYPCAGDLKINGVWLSETRHLSEALDQSYDFSCGELSTRFKFCVGDVAAEVAVLTFCDRVEPTLVCQEIVLIPGADCEVELRAIVDAGNVEGRALRQMRGVPGGSPPACDGALLWESAGAFSTCGIAYATRAYRRRRHRARATAVGGQQLTSDYRFHAQAGRHYVPSPSDKRDPESDAQATRPPGGKTGLREQRARVRRDSRRQSRGLGRVVEGSYPDQRRSGAMATTRRRRGVLPSDLHAFGGPRFDVHLRIGDMARLPLLLWPCDVGYRDVHRPAPEPSPAGSGGKYSRLPLPQPPQRGSNARLRGRRGAQFPWQCAPSTGEECAPMPGSASWHEDHVSLDVAHAFALHAYITSDDEFLRTKAWPVLAEVAKWIESRVTRTARGYEIKAAMGIAERKQPADNSAFTNMSAVVVLRDALWAAKKLGRPVSPIWLEIAETMVLPMRDDVVISHDGFQADEEKGGTPDPLMGIFPLGYPLERRNPAGNPQLLSRACVGLSRQSDVFGALRRVGGLLWGSRPFGPHVGGGLPEILRPSLHADA